MDAPRTPLRKSSRLGNWLAKHLVAMIAAAIVLGVLGLKNERRYQPMIRFLGIEMPQQSRVFGWPKLSAQLEYDVTLRQLPGHDRYTFVASPLYKVTSWPSLLQDAAIAIVSLIITWILFTRTQRRCERWWQLSLTTILAFVLLAAVACAVLRPDAIEQPVFSDEQAK